MLGIKYDSFHYGAGQYRTFLFYKVAERQVSTWLEIKQK